MTEQDRVVMFDDGGALSGGLASVTTRKREPVLTREQWGEGGADD